MSKSFGKIKKELENDWISDSVEGRVLYQLTKYRKSHDSRYGRVTILLDKETIINTSDIERIFKHGFIHENHIEALDDGMIDTNIFYSSYKEYTNNSIDDNIKSKNTLIRLFTIFDKRVGKKRFKELKDILIGNALWLKTFYEFRYKCEYE